MLIISWVFLMVRFVFFIFILCLFFYGQEVRFTTLVINNVQLTGGQYNSDSLRTIDLDNSSIVISSGNAIEGFIDVRIDNSTITTVREGNAILGTGGANEILINRTTLTGIISTLGGDDVITITNSTITGDMRTGAGKDRVILSNTTLTGDVDLGIGNDRLVIVESNGFASSEDLDIIGGGGTDILSLGGSGSRRLGDNLTITGFETLNKESVGTWRINASLGGASGPSEIRTFGILAGTLVIDDDAFLNLNGSTITINSGANFTYNESVVRSSNSRDTANLTNNVTLKVDGRLTLNNRLNLSTGGSLTVDGMIAFLNTTNQVSLPVHTFIATDGAVLSFEFDDERPALISVASTATVSGTITLNITNTSFSSLEDGDSFTVVDFTNNPVQANLEDIVVTTKARNREGAFVVSRSGTGNDIVLTFRIRRIVLNGSTVSKTTTQTASAGVETPEIVVQNNAVLRTGANNAIVGFQTVTVERSATVASTATAITTTADDDKITITANVEGDISTLAGNDTITLSGSGRLTGDISTLAGNDIVRVTSGVNSLAGVISTGDDEDKVTIDGTSNTRIFNVNTPTTIINTGAGNDEINLTDVFLNQVIDGGAGSDIINLRGTGTFNSSNFGITNVEKVILNTGNWTLNNGGTLLQSGSNTDFVLAGGTFTQQNTAIINLGTGDLDVQVGATYNFNYDANNSNGLTFGLGSTFTVSGVFSFRHSNDASINVANFDLQGTLIGATVSTTRTHVVADSVSLSNGVVFSNIYFSNGGTLLDVNTNGTVNISGQITVNLIDASASAASFTNGQVFTLIDASATGVTVNYGAFNGVVNTPNVRNLNGTFILQRNATNNNLEVVFRADVKRVSSDTTTAQAPASGETVLILGNNVDINLTSSAPAISGFSTIRLLGSNKVVTTGATAITTTSASLNITGSNASITGGILGGVGADSISLTGGIISLASDQTTGGISTGNGNDRVVLSGVNIGVDIATGDDNDSVEIKGNTAFRRNIDLGSGNDELSLSGNITLQTDNTQRIDGAAGTDKLTLAGTSSNSFNGRISNFETVVKNERGTWNFNAGSSLSATTLEVNAGNLIFLAGKLNDDSPPVTVSNGASLTVTGAITIASGAQLTLNRHSNTDAPASAHSSLATVGGEVSITGKLTSNIDINFGSQDITVDTGGSFKLGTLANISYISDISVSGTIDLSNSTTQRAINSVRSLTIGDRGSFVLGNNRTITFSGTGTGARILDVDHSLSLGENSRISGVETLDLDGTLVLDDTSSITTTNLALSDNSRIDFSFFNQVDDEDTDNIDESEPTAALINTTDVSIVDATEDKITLNITNNSLTNLVRGTVFILIDSANTNTLTADNFELALPKLRGFARRFRVEKRGNDIVVIYSGATQTLRYQNLTEAQVANSEVQEPSISLNNTTITISEDNTDIIRGYQNVTLTNSSLIFDQELTDRGNAITATSNNDSITIIGTNTSIRGAVVTGSGADTVNYTVDTKPNSDLLFNFGVNAVDDGDEDTFEGDTLILDRILLNNEETPIELNFGVSNLERLNKTGTGTLALGTNWTVSQEVNIQRGQLTINSSGFLTTSTITISNRAVLEIAESGRITASSIDIKNGGVFRILGTVAPTTILDISGTLELEDKTLQVATLNLRNRAQIHFQLAVSDIGETSGTNAKINFTNITAPTNLDLFFTPKLKGDLRSYSVGDTFLILNSPSSLGLDLTTTRFTSDNITYDIDLTTRPNQLRLHIREIKTLDTLEVSSDLRVLATELGTLDRALVDNATSADAVLLERINNLSESQRIEAVHYVAPSTHAATVSRLADVVSSNKSVINGRLNLQALVFKPIYTQGPSSEVKKGDTTWWLDYSYGGGDRENMRGAFGYSYDSNTVRLGVEKEANSTLLGLVLSYSNVDYDNNSSGVSNADVFSLSWYHSLSKEHQFNDFLIDFSLSQTSNKRSIMGGANTLAILDSDVVSASFSLAYNYSYREKFSNNKYLYPTFGVFYNISRFNDFEERGGLGFRIDSQDYSSWGTRLGLRFENQKKGDIGSATLYFQAFWDYNFDDLERDIDAVLVNVHSDQSLRIRGIKEEASNFVLGAGWNMKRQNYQYGIAYDYRFSSTAKSHNITFQYKYSF